MDAFIGQAGPRVRGAGQDRGLRNLYAFLAGVTVGDERPRARFLGRRPCLVWVLIHNDTRWFLQRCCRRVFPVHAWNLIVARGLDLILSLPRLDLLVVDGCDTSLHKGEPPLSVTTAQEDASSDDAHGEDREHRAQGYGQRLIAVIRGCVLRRTGVGVAIERNWLVRRGVCHRWRRPGGWHSPEI